MSYSANRNFEPELIIGNLIGYSTDAVVVNIPMSVFHNWLSDNGYDLNTFNIEESSSEFSLESISTIVPIIKKSADNVGINIPVSIFHKWQIDNGYDLNGFKIN